MKKVLYYIIPACILVLASCSPEGMSHLPGSWTLGESTTGAFSATGSTVTNTLIASNDFPPSPDSLFFYFNTYPTAAGSYTIVNSMTPAPGQVGVRLTEGAPPTEVTYVPAPNPTSYSATVTLSSGKVSIKVPLMKFVNVVFPSDTEDFVSAINQTQ